MNEETKKALERMKVLKKIVNSDIGDIDKYYILKWYDSGWRDEEWVNSEIEYRKINPLKELKSKM